MSRGHIVHVIPHLVVNGVTAFVSELAHNLSRYAHTLLYETQPEELDLELIMQLQANGLDTLQVDAITPDVLERSGYTGAIMYNVTGHKELGEVLPSLYYSYGIYDREVGCDATVAASVYARKHGRYSDHQGIGLVIPPMINTVPLRRMPLTARMFTVGLLTSGAYEKYPVDLVMRLLHELPSDNGIMLSTLPKYPGIGVQEAIATREASSGSDTLRLCPVRITGGVKYAASTNVVVIASSVKHREPYSRQTVEAMAMGKVVIAERRGVNAARIEHGVTGLLFDTPEECIAQIRNMQEDGDARRNIGEAARRWASTQDTVNHIGKLKKLLRDLAV